MKPSCYTYDANGNRLSRTAGGVTEYGTYDDQDRLVQYGNATYTYSANGDLRSKTENGQTTRYQYDALGNLVRVDLPDGTRIDYLIDGQGQRVGRKVNGALVQQWAYHGPLRPMAELDGAGGTVSRFIYGSRLNAPDYLIQGSQELRVVYDFLGSPRFLVEAALGAIVDTRNADEFGIQGQAAGGNRHGFPFGFEGGLTDSLSGLVHFGARDYSSAEGRWTIKDPIGFDGGLNTYNFVLGDPINYNDPSGLAIGDYPPPPPGYNPETWGQGKWDNGKWVLTDPEGNTYTIHPEGNGHWPHWDKQDKDGNDDGEVPPNSGKPWQNQKRGLKGNQCATNPNGNAAPWSPLKISGLGSAYPVLPALPGSPTPLPDLPGIPPLEGPLLIPGIIIP